MSRLLDDFLCQQCPYEGEHFHVSGESVPCPLCGEAMLRLPPRTQHIENYGALGVQHTRGRRLSPAERERREHYNRTRFGEQAPPDATPRPKVFG